jgi:hypothetical protein
LARLITDKMLEDEHVDVSAEREHVEALVARAINENLEEEAALDADVRDLLLKHSAVMIREGVDQRTAFIKVKLELAKRKGFVL